MAMTTCGECGRSISGLAASCPRCGAPNITATDDPGCIEALTGCLILPVYVILFLLAAVLLLAMVVGVFVLVFG